MKSFKRTFSLFLMIVFTLFVALNNCQATATTSKATLAKIKEAKAIAAKVAVTKSLVSKATAAKNLARTKADSAKSINTKAIEGLNAATANAAAAKSLNERILSIKLLEASKLAASKANTAMLLGDKELKLAVDSYNWAVKAKVLTAKIVQAKTAKTKAAAIKAADAAIKAAKIREPKVTVAVKTSKAALNQVLTAIQAYQVAADEVAVDKAATEKAAAEKAAAEKAAAEKAAAEKAAAEKAAAEKAAAEKAAAEKAAAEKAAAEKAAAEKAAAQKILVTSISVAAPNNAIVMQNGSSLQMTATVAPINAWDKTVTWIVAPGTGTAVINKTTGLLTATGAGTITVVGINPTSGVTGIVTISIVVLAPTMTNYSVLPGTVLGSTRIIYYAGYGNTLRYYKQQAAFPAQIIGADVSNLTYPYVSGNNILGAAINDHIGLYEVNANNKIVKFMDILLYQGRIALAAPEMTGYVVSPGTVAGSTKITYTPASGNTLRFIKQSGMFFVPLIGTNANTIAASYYTSGTNILNAAYLQHIGLYEIDSNNLVVKFADIRLETTNIAAAAPAITGYVVGPGTVVGSTKITYTPSSGNTVRYIRQSVGFTTPLTGTNFGTIGTTSTLLVSGENIVGVAASQHIGLYEINPYNIVVKFLDITLSAGNISIASTTPVIVGYVVEQGTVANSTKITYTPGSGNTLRYAKQAGAFATQVTGTKINVANYAYTSGENILAVAPGQHIGLFEIDASSSIVKFVDITLGAGNIATTAVAPAISGYVIERGTVVGSTKILYTPGSGNFLRYVIKASTVTTPLVGDTVGNISGISPVYTSGANITGVTAMQHIGLYEVDNGGFVVKFVDITLGAGNIAATAADPAPVIVGYVVEQGTVAGATKITYTPGLGNSLAYVKQANAFTIPLVGESKSELGLTNKEYIAGNDILNAIATQHIGLYELGATGLLVKFKDITLGDGDIAVVAPVIVGYTIAPGTQAGATKITYLVSGSNKLRYVKQATAFTIPLVGTDVHNIGTAYTSDADIQSVSIDQHIGLYEVDANDKVVQFIDIKLIAENIAH